jgi:hypothetical protein
MVKSLSKDFQAQLERFTVLNQARTTRLHAGRPRGL